MSPIWIRRINRTLITIVCFVWYTKSPENGLFATRFKFPSNFRFEKNFRFKIFNSVSDFSLCLNQPMRLRFCKFCQTCDACRLLCVSYNTETRFGSQERWCSNSSTSPFLYAVKKWYAFETNSTVFILHYLGFLDKNLFSREFSFFLPKFKTELLVIRWKKIKNLFRTVRTILPLLERKNIGQSYKKIDDF